MEIKLLRGLSSHVSKSLPCWACKFHCLSLLHIHYTVNSIVIYEDLGYIRLWRVQHSSLKLIIGLVGLLLHTWHSPGPVRCSSTLTPLADRNMIELRQPTPIRIVNRRDLLPQRNEFNLDQCEPTRCSRQHPV